MARRYKEVVVDLGTGDGRFVFSYARENPNSFVIGVDPSHKQMSIYSKKVNKEKLENAIFVVGSVEKLPEMLNKTADRVFVNFPWGSLLGGIANAESDIVKNISGLLKKGGRLPSIGGI